MNAANYVTVAGFGERNPQVDTSAYSSATLSGVITRASQRVDDFLGYSLPIEVITNEKQDGIVDADLNLAIFPKKQNIQTVEQIQVVKGTDSITLSLTSGSDNRYDIVDDRIYYSDSQLSTTTLSTLTLGSFVGLRHKNFFTKLNYTAGYVTIPSWAIEATDLYVLDILARGLNTGGAKSIKQGAISIAYSERSGKSELVEDAESILSGYRRVSGF